MHRDIRIVTRATKVPQRDVGAGVLRTCDSRGESRDELAKVCVVSFLFIRSEHADN